MLIIATNVHELIGENDSLHWSEREEKIDCLAILPPNLLFNKINSSGFESFVRTTYENYALRCNSAQLYTHSKFVFKRHQCHLELPLKYQLLL